MQQVYSPKLGGLILGCAALLSVASVGWTISIKPGVQILQTKPGGTTKAVYEVINTQDKPLTARIEFRDSFVLSANKDIGASAWLFPDVKEVQVPPKGSRKVSFKIKVPAQAQGELAALVSFIPQSSAAESAKAERPKDLPPGTIETTIVPVITVSLYVRTEGRLEGKASVDLTKVSLLPATDKAPARVQTTVVVKNTGNMHQRPRGHFEIFKREDPNKKSVMVLDFPVGWPVMPEAEHTYTAIQDGTLSPGAYGVRSLIEFSPTAQVQGVTHFTVDEKGVAKDFVEVE